MKRLLKTCLCLLLLAPTLYAGGISPAPAWTRQLSPAAWQNLSRRLFFRFSTGKASFLGALRPLAPTCMRIKTTDQKFIYHHIYYSNLFNKQEKAILLKTVAPQATLGKFAFLHDKHAALFNQLQSTSAGAISEDAFWKHQQILQEMLQTLEAHYLPTLQEQFASQVFSKEEIARLQKHPAQPTAYILTSGELREFGVLPSLEQQQNWVDLRIFDTEHALTLLLAKHPEDLSPQDFANYYTKTIKLHYLKLLGSTLTRATQKRVSAIVRYKLPLVQGGPKLTDAQRGGRILFDFDTKPVEQTMAQFNEFKKVYEPYAAAEALGAPYEWALQYGARAPELLGWQEGQRLRRLTPKECLDELGPKTLELELQLSQMRETPDFNAPADFYTTYYRLYTISQIYQTLLARARLALHHL